MAAKPVLCCHDAEAVELLMRSVRFSLQTSDVFGICKCQQTVSCSNFQAFKCRALSATAICHDASVNGLHLFCIKLRQGSCITIAISCSEQLELELELM